MPTAACPVPRLAAVHAGDVRCARRDCKSPDQELRGVLIAFTVFEYLGTVLGHHTRDPEIDHLPRFITYFLILDAGGFATLRTDLRGCLRID